MPRTHRKYLGDKGNRMNKEWIAPHDASPAAGLLSLNMVNILRNNRWFEHGYEKKACFEFTFKNKERQLISQKQKIKIRTSGL